MTKPDFEKIFASGGTTLPLTDSQFLQGFAYLGENPPTKEEFNWLFQQLCLKMQWLNQNAGFGRWQADHTYATGEICFSSVIGDYRFAECTVGGQSGTLEPTWSTVGSTAVDGSVTWVVRDLRQGTSIGKVPALVDVGGGKAGLPAVSGKLLTDISGMPIGSVVPFLANKAQPGWLACDTGALVSRATYPELWTWVQANAPLISETDWQTQAAAQSSVGAYSTGDGSTTFRLPRILDYVRGGLIADVGKWQGDAIRNITGSITTAGGGFITAATGTFATSNAYNPQSFAPGSGSAYRDFSFDASRLVATADENRPKTVKMLYCVKAFDATTNQGLIDITALANGMAAKVNVVEYVADHAKSLTANGYQKLPSGLIIQWGTTAAITSDGRTMVTFPIAFPTACLSAVANFKDVTFTNHSQSFGIGNLNAASFEIENQLIVTSPSVSLPAVWIALGC